MGNNVDKSREMQLVGAAVELQHLWSKYSEGTEPVLKCPQACSDLIVTRLGCGRPADFSTGNFL